MVSWILTCNWPCYPWVSQSLSGYQWTLWQCFPFNQNFLKFSKQQQMVQKFPGKFSGNSRNCWISGIWTFQPKILEILGEKFNWKKTFGKIFLKIWVYLAMLSIVHPQHLLLYCTMFFRAAKLVGLNVLQLMNENTAG